jgi:hypothetical protein
MKKEQEIRCPHCAWRPQPESRWQCMPSCGTEWNTFWTRGTCPGCGYHWAKTQCLSCGELSPHEQWYHTPTGEAPKVEETEDLSEPA